MSELQPQDHTFDLANVKISICGIPIRGGFTGEEVIRIVRKSPAFESEAGPDGSVVWLRNHDDRADVFLTLSAGALANDSLSALHNSDKNTPNGAGVGRFLLEDMNGRLLIEAAHCRIMSDPEVALGKSPGPREWPIELASCKGSLGGLTALP